MDDPPPLDLDLPELVTTGVTIVWFNFFAIQGDEIFWLGMRT